MARPRLHSRRTLLSISVTALVAAAAVGVLSLTLPGRLARDYDAKSLASLKKQAQRTRDRFASLLARLESQKARFSGTTLPADAASFVPLFRQSGLDAENEGIAVCNGDGFLEAWFGNVLSLADLIDHEDLGRLQASGGSVLVRSKATVYAIALQPLSGGGRLMAYFLRLAFLPQIRSSYIREYHALRPALRAEFDVDYWDFREDVQGFDKFFARHRDEFTGQPRQENEIQTLFFPLRNETGRIVATVTLASPSLTSRLTLAREDLRLVLLLALVIAGCMALAFVWSSPRFRRGRDLLSYAAGAVLLVGVRFAALPLGSLERIQSLGPFDPAVAGFVSAAGLTRSPADIFLTAATALGLALGLAGTFGRGRSALPPAPLSAGRAIVSHAAAAGLAAGAFLVLHGAARRIIFNSNLSLLRWDFDTSRLLLQLGLFLFLAAVLLILSVAFRLAFPRPGTPLLSGSAGALGAAAAFLAVPGPSVLLAAASAVLAAWLFAAAVVPGLARRRETWLAGLILASFWTARTLDGTAPPGPISFSRRPSPTPS